MRLLPLVAAVAFALMAAAPAAAHEGDHAEHLSIRIDDLEPGQERILTLSFEEGEFAAGWIFFVYGSVQAEQALMEIELRKPDNETAVASWTWQPGRFHTNSTLLPETSEYVLALRNTHESETLRYAFYFDQSCECSDKTIGLPGGWGLFNLKAPADRRINFTMGVYHFDTQLGGPVEPHGVRVQATAAHLVDERARWPEDFANVTTAEATDSHLVLEWETEEAGAQYVWVQILEGASPQRPVFLLPKITQEEAGGGDAAGPGGLALLLAVAFAVAVVGRLKRTP